LSAALAHLEGDGIAVGVLSLQVLDTLAGVSAEPRVWRRDGRRLVASLGWAVHRLRWGDGTGSTASHMSAGAGIEYGAFRIWLSAETPLGGWLRTRVGWALGWRSPMFQAALGWRMEQGRRAVPASAVRASVGIFLLTAGLWGAPPAPSLGVLLPAGGWGVGAEIRHVPGPGTCVLWSFAFPCGIRP